MLDLAVGPLGIDVLQLVTQGLVGADGLADPLLGDLGVPGTELYLAEPSEAVCLSEPKLGSAKLEQRGLKMESTVVGLSVLQRLMSVHQMLSSFLESINHAIFP